ncbi:MAG: hypothetical protein H7343_03800 [Undibacterium sp.]|nr:hypothetical protein [Opitutaceae bacterium]
MDLRRFVLILIYVVAAAHAAAAPTKSYPLDERTIYSVRLSREEPTTCVFPGALKAIVGANVSTKIEDNPAVLLSHEAGTEYFSLRSLKENAVGAPNVLFRGRVYALSFSTAAEADRAVVFLDEPLNGGPPRKLSSEILRALIERARQQDRPAAQFPGTQVFTDRAPPGSVTAYRNFTATIESITRFEAEDALVFHVKLENSMAVAVPYDPQGLAIRRDREFFPAAFAGASGAIPGRGISFAYLVIAGGPAGRANLSVREKFSVIVPRP